MAEPGPTDITVDDRHLYRGRVAVQEPEDPSRRTELAERIVRIRAGRLAGGGGPDRGRRDRAVPDRPRPWPSPGSGRPGWTAPGPRAGA
ncbi:hypothetical protein D0Z06_22740 [Geodermatophilus marinus]|nr:hypothetical protein D0Z06_22740 [Geodermatophilus sp. LHW52908]